MSENRFANVIGIEELVAQTVGAGSSPKLWLSDVGLPAVRDEHGNPCVFDSAAASEIVTESLERLSQMLGGLS